MSNLLHPMVRRSEKGPRADTAGDKDPFSGSDGQPYEMESHLTSSETTTESQSTDSADELSEPVAAEMASSVNGSPGVEMGMSGDATPVPEVELEDHAKVNTSIPGVKSSSRPNSETMSDIINECTLTKYPGELHALHSADDRNMAQRCQSATQRTLSQAAR